MADVDPEAAAEVVRFCSELIRIDTANVGGDADERPAAEYAAALLAEAGLDPLILEGAPRRANVVARVAGRDSTLPAILLHGHLDTVPADPAEWTRDPWSGEVEDGVVWGRGAVDMKDVVAMVLALVRSWARRGAAPRRDVVIAFTADEEATAVPGSGFLADKHADLFEGCTEAIGESGAFTYHGFPGLRVYPVAAGERGTAWMRLTAKGTAGHGSRRNPDNAVAKLAAAVTRLTAHEWPRHEIPTVTAAIAALAAAGVPREAAEASSLIADTLRDSAAPTMLQAGYKVNVVPGDARAWVDGRVLPGRREEFEETIGKLLGSEVAWEYEHQEVALEAPTDGPIFAAMADALRAADPGAVVVPYLMAGGTDAKQFSRLGIVGYGFGPLRLPPGFDYKAMFHGVDERVPVEALEFGVEVLDRFLTSY